MRVVSLVFVFLSLSLVSAQEGMVANQPQEQQKIPTTLSEAHAELERILPPEALAEIDGVPSEHGMIRYHKGLGAGIRYNWGLWRDSPLAKHMQQLGFTHPDEMSDVILKTFWCKRHGQEFRLKERAAESKKFWDVTQKAQEEEKNRVQKANGAIRNMMMGLRFEKRDVPVVRMPIKNGVNVRSLYPFRGGVFLTAYRQGRISSDLYAISGGLHFDSTDGTVRTSPQYDDGVARGFYRDLTVGGLRKMKPGDDFYTLGFYLDLADRKIRRIRLAEFNEVYAAVVVGDKAWFAGLARGKAVLVGVGKSDRITVRLPQEDEIPDLALDAQSLLAVYPNTIYRLTGREWTIVHSGDILLPRSGVPPELHGNMVFLRDEGRGERSKRLWWLTMGEQLHLSTLDHDTGLVGEEGPRWDNVLSYHVTTSGDLWACVGEAYGPKSLLRRSKDGSYSIAIMNDSVQFTGDLLASGTTDQGLSVSAVRGLLDDTLLLAGNTGIYRLKGNELVQELAFAPEKATDGSGRIVRHGNWNPNAILMLDEQSYVIGCDSWNGAYLLRKANDGQWNCLPVDESRDTIDW